MKNERLLNIVLGVLLLLMMVVVARHEDCILGGKDAGRQPAEGVMVEMRLDTVWLHDTLYTAGPAVVREEVGEVPARVDTAAILAAFYTERTLSDSFRLRDLATVRITDKVFGNDIVSRVVDYDLGMMVPGAVSVTDRASTRDTQPCRLALTVGAQMGGEQAAVMAGLRWKRAEVLGGYDLRLHVPSVIFKYDVWQW